MNFMSKVGYGIGQLSDGTKQAAFNTFLFFYYNQVLGLSGSLAGLAALLSLVADAITDPMVGHLSDRLRSKWGRRHPYMLAGVIPFFIAMYALFSPPGDMSQLQLFSWMLGMAIALRFALTLFYVPHLSLGAELVDDYHEKTSLIGYRVFFTYAGIVLVSVIGFAVFFPPTEAYPNGLLNAESYSGFGFFCAVLASSAMLVSIFSTRKAIPHLRAPEINDDNNVHPVMAVFQVLRTLKLASFRNIFFVILLFTSLAGLSQTLLVYTATYVFGFTAEHLAGLSMSIVIGLLFASVVAQKLSKRFDKRKSLSICVTLGCFTAFTPITMYVFGILQLMDFGSKFALIFIMNGLSQIFFIAYVILIDSMLSDVIDENEFNTGNREEGLFFAARSFATKASFGLGALMAGIALDVIALPKSALAADVAPETVNLLAILGGPGLMLFFLSTILISRNYPLNEARHQEIMAGIKLNNQKKAALAEAQPV
jgi:GPH family glycoside/pentoside/hexuronide:cation symporter